MTAAVYPTQAEADLLAARIDAALGWPKVGAGVCQAQLIGPGMHVDHPLCCTQRHVAVIKHPALSLWAVPIDAIGRRVAGTIVEISLDGTWNRLP